MAKYDYKPGDTLRLAQDFRVIRGLGSGGMGAVYLAEHRELYRNFAVKVLHAEHWNRTDLITMFGYEARTVARLGEPEPHPGIIEVVDLGRTRDRGRMPYMVMPYLIGETLHEVLERHAREGRPKMPVLEAIGLVTRLCQALDHAHERGVVHRDVKPQNIFVPLTSEGRTIKVLDWGISKLLEQADNPEVFISTPSYASKEQMLGEGIGPLSDVYSAGVVLYRCLTGRLPFDEYGHDFRELIAAISVAAPRLSRRGEFPPELEALVASALSKDASARPPDALAFAEELQKIGSAIRAARDPHAHVTDRVERPAADAQIARPEPVTAAGIAERTEEDPDVQKWVEAQRRRWHDEGLVVEADDGEGGAGARVVYARRSDAPPADPAAEITGFERTEERPEPAGPNTTPEPRASKFREAPTNIIGPASAPVGGAPSVRYVTKEQPRAAAQPNRTVPMAAPRGVVQRTVPLLARPEGQTPSPVVVSSARARGNGVTFAKRFLTRWRWLFGSATWKQNGWPMIAAAVTGMLLVLGAFRLSGRLFSSHDSSAPRATVAAEPVPATVELPPGSSASAPARPVTMPAASGSSAAVIAPVAVAPTKPAIVALPVSGAPVATSSTEVGATGGMPRPTTVGRRVPAQATPPASGRVPSSKPTPGPAPSQVGFDDVIRTL